MVFVLHCIFQNQPKATQICLILSKVTNRVTPVHVEFAFVLNGQQGKYNLQWTKACWLFYDLNKTELRLIRVTVVWKRKLPNESESVTSCRPTVADWVRSGQTNQFCFFLYWSVCCCDCHPCLHPWMPIYTDLCLDYS